MDKQQLKRLLDVAAGREKADLVIKNAHVVDVYGGGIIDGDIALCGDLIAGVGEYTGAVEIDAEGRYATPGFIDSHIHIESSYVSPEEIGRMLAPHGGTTIIADPHEIVNVCGMAGMEYMLAAAEETALDVKFVLPSCVPATPWEHSGANIDATAMREPLQDERIIGLGEFMDYPGVINAADGVLDKLLAAYEAGKLIDGHSPAVYGKDLNAYAAARILNDHECGTVQEMQDRISRGMYVLLRQGSACHDLRNLLRGLTRENSRRCLLCSDDRQPKTMLELGHLDDHLRICVQEGVDAITAIRMATLNAAECFRLHDRGGIAPGLRADIVLMDDLKDFQVRRVFIAGREVANEGKYLPSIRRHSIAPVTGSFHVASFSAEKLRLPLKSDLVYTIGINPGSVVTTKRTDAVRRNTDGNFLFDPALDIAKVAVVERHQGTGNVALGLLHNYGIKAGAVALSIAHDSHNIIVVGTTDADMAFATQQLIAQNGGVVLVKDGAVVESMPMPIGGIMSDQSGEWVRDKLVDLQNAAYDVLKVNPQLDPVMTLCFMSLAVIPEIKITDIGLFDVAKFDFIPVEANV
ncbi:adenine deaminase [Ruminococcaceae bacterium OttesenSCG-928-D13]|nr:adenine deaminase [Ruminococcaceae bacterium OttesenSCG-928-D13]